MENYRRTERTRVRRLPERGHYDRATVHAILDAGFICHVGYVIEGQPYVTPTAYWREGERVYWHGSSASRMLRNLAKGIPVCLTVTHVDGLVLARTGFNHSINYRAVMALGVAEQVTEEEHKLAALKEFVERLYPKRWDTLRPPSKQELKATTVFSMQLDEVSAKVRVGPPHDNAEDYALPIWAGVLPLTLTPGMPEPDPLNLAGLTLPEHVRDFVLER